MKESTTYQHFFREARDEGKLEGRLEGRLDGKIGTLLNILNSRFGAVPLQVQAKIQAINDLATLDAAILKAITVSSLDELAL